MITEHDHLEIRCPMLGHPLHFSYCRSANLGDPCRKIFDCWFTRIDIKKFVQENFSDDKIEKLASPPKPKVLSILEIAQRAMEAQKINEKISDAD
jgi:hypothetical protein